MIKRREIHLLMLEIIFAKMDKEKKSYIKAL